MKPLSSCHPIILSLFILLLLTGCVAGQQEYRKDPGPPIKYILVKDYAWYEYNEQWFNLGGPAPWYIYPLIPIMYLAL